MRSTSKDLTCFDCKNCIDRQGISHGFCKEENEPIGGLDWPIDDFDKYPAHIFPTYAERCENFGLRTQFAIRGKHLLIYATCAEQLSLAYSSLREVRAR